MQISVIGSSAPDDAMYQLAYELGKELAPLGHVVINGGRGGIMEGVSRGVKEMGGLVIGILPGDTRRSGNGHLSAEVVTGMGEMRNFLLVLSGDLIIAFPGSYGTVSEISFSMRNNKRIIIVRPDLHEYQVRGANVLMADGLEEIMNHISGIYDIR
ncbi:MAG: TIGR00725 family protein [Candidatus Methanofastidiosa archaeon]|nr:TIGR00725 family protein [Candidatus Methanofastidiosa archaeon]